MNSYSNKISLQNSNYTNKIINIAIVLLYLSLMLTGIVPQMILSIIVLGAATVITFYNKPHIVFPAMLFYYSQLDKIAGLAVFRIYTIIFIFILMFNNYKKLILNKIHFALLIVYFLYCILVLAKFNIQNGVFAFFDVVCLLIFTRYYISDESGIKEFFKHFAIVALFAYVTGVVTDNIMDVTSVIDKTEIDMKRYMATFNDPNYMGFFYTTAIFSLVCLKNFKKKFRIILICILYLMVLSTLSVTAILCNILMWIIYLVINKKIKFKIIFGIIGLVFFIFIMVKLADVFNISMIQNLVIRLGTKFESFLEGDMDAVTTDRTSLTDMHFDYYMSQDTLKILFGGNLVNSIVINMPMLGNSAAHNEYVDLLLNVGIIGTIIIIIYPISRIIKSCKDFKQNKDSYSLFVMIEKFIWLYYAATLTLFLDMRFMILYFI